MAVNHDPDRLLPEVPLLSQMTQEGALPGNTHPGNGGAPNFASDDVHKRRPWSSQGIKSVLSPSPTLIETRRLSKDDHDVDSSPVTPKRSGTGTRLGQSLSLQMPPRDVSSTSTANLTTKRIPISPKPESSPAFTSPTSVLPRHSRGMDFSRAATNLHHSTLAEQSSPESSPTVNGRRGIMIPPRKGFSSPANSLNNPESPSMHVNSLWTSLPNTERSCLSSSVASSSMMDDDSGTSSSDQDEMMDFGEDEDTIHMTPQVNGIGLVNPFGSVSSSPGGDAIGGYPATAAKLLSYQRARVQGRRNRARNSSSSGSGQSIMQSPGPHSPPLLKTIESNMSIAGGFFLEEPAKKEIESRRQSLSLGTNDMHLSDAEQSEDDTLQRPIIREDLVPPTPTTPSMEERKEVVRRAVTRRGNLLPKSKGFARIRAALLEEGAPVDTEVRREAEVIRQVRESDTGGDIPLNTSQPTTSVSSPSLGPTIPVSSDNTGNGPEDTALDSEDSSTRRSSSAFSTQAIKNSSGPSFWNTWDERMRTPPPINPVPRSSSSGISDDMNVETPQSSVLTMTPQHNLVRGDEGASSSQAAAITRKGNKRMRDDDFDPNYFKRRAVSPGLSVQNSPVLPQSPGWWASQSRANNSASVYGERSGSNGSVSSVNAGCAPKRVGLQGMNDTNDGLMNMSIE